MRSAGRQGPRRLERPGRGGFSNVTCDHNARDRSPETPKRYQSTRHQNREECERNDIGHSEDDEKALRIHQERGADGKDVEPRSEAVARIYGVVGEITSPDGGAMWVCGHSEEQNARHCHTDHNDRNHPRLSLSVGFREHDCEGDKNRHHTECDDEIHRNREIAGCRGDRSLKTPPGDSFDQ